MEKPVVRIDTEKTSSGWNPAFNLYLHTCIYLPYIHQNKMKKILYKYYSNFSCIFLFYIYIYIFFYTLFFYDSFFLHEFSNWWFKYVLEHSLSYKN